MNNNPIPEKVTIPASREQQIPQNAQAHATSTSGRYEVTGDQPNAEAQKVIATFAAFAHKLNDAPTMEQYIKDNILTGKYKETPEYAEYLQHKVEHSTEGFHINRRAANLPYSLIIGDDGSIEILLKRKVDNVPAGERINARGLSKTIKTTLDLSTGQYKVQATFDVSHIARKRAEGKGIPLTDKAALKRIEAEVIAEIKKNEYELQNQFCGIKATNFTVYTVAPTPQRSDKEMQRADEGKPSRLQGDVVVSFTMMKADGEIADPALAKRIRGTTNVTGVSPTYKKFIIDLLEQAQRFHQSDPPMVFQDIKTNNILVLGNDTHLIDLGLVRTVDQNGKLDSDDVQGTPYTMSPELLQVRFALEINSMKQGLLQIKRNKNLISEQDYKIEIRRLEEDEAYVLKEKRKIDYRKNDAYSVGATIYEVSLLDDPDLWYEAITDYSFEADRLMEDQIRPFFRQVNGTPNPSIQQIRKWEGDIQAIEGQAHLVHDYISTILEDSRLELEVAHMPAALCDLVQDLLSPMNARISLPEAIAKAKALPVNS